MSSLDLEDTLYRVSSRTQLQPSVVNIIESVPNVPESQTKSRYENMQCDGLPMHLPGAQKDIDAATGGPVFFKA
ncbi:hypothetical protein E2P81_ATG07876 [Venturia nashicola]|uniref:Uncharacterized protein n=1 Tax=Venturia nashicola TaxID=86259 RepID=A0A4Z1P2K4_9PEZI|nr:hypothetical protein E6O75_ATG08046 [Venturia nashicola]TLD22683.1 hypothetical protein E2P81_ATG07876 [Venturia nashicola]